MRCGSLLNVAIVVFWFPIGAQELTLDESVCRVMVEVRTGWVFINS